ncbi:MAG TPA: sugar phosphate nucleotidyltransferase [Acidimicrobiales bacterium]|nr:sugar phosphate nucleotidyltransferase [Acidimicrobiales bacterium]
MPHSLTGGEPLVAVVLAAGSGTRLRPLTRLLPKALCPVGGVALLDLSLGRARAVTRDVAVNVHHGRSAMEAHLAALDEPVHVSVEEAEALGTAGALGHLRDWIAGRPVLVVNVDAWHHADLAAFAAGWDGERPRLLTVGPRPAAAFGPRRPATWGDDCYAGAALLPAAGVERLPTTPAGLWETWWRRLTPGVDLELVRHVGPWFDCGTPASYLAANLEASGGHSVVAPGAVVEGRVEESVVWAGARVEAGEHLYRAVRAPGPLTVLVR